MRAGHLVVVERLGEDRFFDSEFDRDLAQCPAGAGGLGDDLGRPVVTDVRVERGGRGQGDLGVEFVGGDVRFDSGDALLVEHP